MRQLTRDPGGLYRLALASKEAALLKEVLIASERQLKTLPEDAPARPRLEKKCESLREDMEEKFTEVEAAINNAFPEIM